MTALSALIDHDGLPFVVPLHCYQLNQLRGKLPQTVITLEVQIANAAIFEWDEEMSWQRKWCFPTLPQAYIALMCWLDDNDAEEPSGWVRALDAKRVRYQSQEEASAQFGAALLRWAGE